MPDHPAPSSSSDPDRRLLALGKEETASRSAWVPPDPAALAGIFPQLEVLRLIGRGGMGAVYLARQTHLDRQVALKILAPERAGDRRFAERFAREARAMARLQHPHIVTLHDFGQAGGWAYLVMEHVEGATLRQVMATGRLSPSEALALVPPLCEALAHAHAHAQGVVHRDLKPENILIDGRGRPRIADFGLAKLADADGTLTASGATLGTLHYMAPEQVAGAADLDHRADLYALGVMLYEMLTGNLPLGRFAPPSQAAGTDRRLDQVVFKSLERDPCRRWQSADELRQALAGAVAPEEREGQAKGERVDIGPIHVDGERVDIGPIHIDGDREEVRIGEKLVVDRHGVRLGRRHQGEHPAAASDGDRRLYRSGMVLVVAGVLAAMAFTLPGGEPHWPGGHERVVFAAVLAMVAGGASLLLRTCLPLAILGAVAALVPTAWLWERAWWQGLLAVVAVLSWGLRVLSVPHLLRHYGSLVWRWKLVTAPVLAVIVVACLALATGPWAYQMPAEAAIQTEAVPWTAEAGDGVQMHNGGLTIESPVAATVPLARVDLAGRGWQSFHLRTRARWQGVQGAAYLEMWTWLPDGRSFFSRTLASGGATGSFSGTHDDWRPVVVPADARGAPAPVRAELSLVLVGGGRVELEPLMVVAGMQP
jgi:hypothetical protein